MCAPGLFPPSAVRGRMSTTPSFEPEPEPEPDVEVGPCRDFVSAVRVVDAFEAGRLRRAAEDAAEIRLLAEAAGAVVVPTGVGAERARRIELDRRSLVAELATATRVSEWTVTRLISEASDLCSRFEAGVAALERGEISRQHLAAIHDAGHVIVDDARRAEFVEIALDRATQLTPGRLAPVLRAIAERFVERTLDERHADANARRDVQVVDLADGQAALTLVHDAALVYGIHDRLTAQARSVIAARDAQESDAQESDAQDGDAEAQEGEAEDSRTMDQLRADIAADTLLCAGPQDCVAGTGLDAIRATVQVTLPVLTMTGTANEPCLLAGFGPIDSGTARALAAGAAGWERVMTSPLTGCVLAVDRYRPGASLDRFLAARDERCRFPGCRQPVWRCDIDHTVDAAHGGATSHCNLAHLCRRHHVMKHSTAWTVEQLSPGVLVWTSPTGRKHTDRPEPVVRFIADEAILDRRRIMREPWLFSPDDPLGGGGTPPF